VSDGTVISQFKGKDRDPHFEWNPGFRLGVGLELTRSNWDFVAIWTHINSKAHNSKEQDAEFNWNLDFDVIDVVAAYNFDVGSCFALRPYVGLRGARIEQKVRYDEQESSKAAALAADLNIPDDHNDQKFTGIGPLVGLEADWNIGCGFSLYANADLSWLYGNFKVRIHELTESEHTFDFYSSDKHLVANIGVADAGIGIRWETCFCNGNRLFLELGLEHHRYFNYNRFCSYGDLTFDGFNAGIGFEF
jgi:hypothetical protein